MSSINQNMTGRALARKFRKLLFWFELTAVGSGLVLGPIANALQLELQSDLAMRSAVSGSTLHKVGLLKAGSVVEIPDGFQKDGADGKFSAELTLNNWLAHAGFDHQAIEQAIGGERNDFFFPVHVVRAKPGSQIEGLSGDNAYYVALRSIAVGDGSQPGLLVTKENTPVFPASDFEPLRSTLADALVQDSASAVSGATENAASQLESRTGCPDGSCSAAEPAAFEKLIGLLSKPLANVDRTRDAFANRTNLNLQQIGARFSQACGVKLRSFVPEVVRQANAAKIPPEFLLSMMVQESGGTCYPVGKEHAHSVGVGLFQVNSADSKIPRCSVQQRQQIRGLSLNPRATGPKCLENPAVNLSEAIRILTMKLDHLTSPTVQTKTETFNGFDRGSLVNDGKFTDTAWRLAMSAYDGGERWVLKAKANLDAFNQKQGTKLNAANWENLRIFYLRSFLNSDQENGKARQAEFFNNESADRNPQMARANLAFTENIVPRDTQYRSSNAPDMTASWKLTLQNLGAAAK